MRKLAAVGLVAVLVVVLGGCALFNPKPPPGILNLSLWLEMPSDVQLGEPVPLKLWLGNFTDSPIKLTFDGRPAYDLVVTGPEGTEIWSLLHGQAIQDILELKTLKPGEKLAFAAEWKQLDNKGKAVPSGAYFVRGILRTRPHKLEIGPRQLIVGSFMPLALDLVIPSWVRAGERVSITLRVKNITDRPVILWGGYPEADFVVTKPDGTEVWRWAHGKVFILILLEMTLQPGEVREYKEFWDQLDNDGKPVPPGTYLVQGIFGFNWVDELPFEKKTEPEKLIIW